MSKKNNNILRDTFQDLGFGSNVSGNKRLIDKQGQFSIVRTISGWRQLHFYQRLVLMSWPKFICLVLFFYLLLNVLFACLYLLIGIEQLDASHLDLGDFWCAFFFSVQTLTTVGYGSVSPVGFGANSLAAIGALVGLLSFALATGLVFARFSQANIKLHYSDNALIAPYKGQGRGLMFRIVNQRRNLLTDLQALVIVTWLEEDGDGTVRRQFRSLPLEREFLPMMPLNWTLVHPIDKKSPIRDWTETQCKELDVEFLIVIQGYDDTFAKTVRSYHSYKWDELVWNARFSPMFYADEQGNTVLELQKLSDYQEVKNEEPQVS